MGDLPAVVDLEALRGSRVHVGVDPLGGASGAYWEAIGERPRGSSVRVEISRSP